MGQWCPFPWLALLPEKQDAETGQRPLAFPLPLPVWSSLPVNELGLEPWASQLARPNVECPSFLSLGQEREERSWLIYSTENQPLPCGVGGRLSDAESLLSWANTNCDRERRQQNLTSGPCPQLGLVDPPVPPHSYRDLLDFLL